MITKFIPLLVCRDFPFSSLSSVGGEGEEVQAGDRQEQTWWQDRGRGEGAYAVEVASGRDRDMPRG